MTFVTRTGDKRDLSQWLGRLYKQATNPHLDRTRGRSTQRTACWLPMKGISVPALNEQKHATSIVRSSLPQALRKERSTVAKIEKTITIHAPVDKVFAYISEPACLPEIWPSMVETRDIKKLPNGGNHFRWVYKMAGMRFEGDSDDAEYVANQQITGETKGGIESTFVWKFQPQADNTQVTLVADYRVPVPLLGKLAEAFIVRQNEHEAETILANLKERMES